MKDTGDTTMSEWVERNAEGWQHQQQQDEQERMETIERLLQTATGAIYEVFGQDYAELWRHDMNTTLGLK